ncbi:MAG: tetratricopeptide repeat protein [Magnetococcales bacterium]|nr:tetratricopeptide repeat protein [Magnetococcales bacterium]
MTQPDLLSRWSPMQRGLTAMILLLAALTMLGGCAKNRLPSKEAQFKNRVMIDKGLAYLARGNARMALRSLQDARKKDPNNLKILSALGQCYDLLGRHQQALKILKAALKVDPENGQIHHDLGVAYMRLDRLADAEEALTRALTDPHFQNAAAANVNRAILYRRQGKKREMARALEEALNVNPAHIPAYLQLAEFYGEFDRYDKQRHYLSQALPHADDPQERAALMERLANVFLKSGERSEALPLLKQIIKLAPQSEMAERARKKITLLE